MWMVGGEQRGFINGFPSKLEETQFFLFLSIEAKLRLAGIMRRQLAPAVCSDGISLLP
jgi:hypothetical protein